MPLPLQVHRAPAHARSDPAGAVNEISLCSYQCERKSQPVIFLKG